MFEVKKTNVFIELIYIFAILELLQKKKIQPLIIASYCRGYYLIISFSFNILLLTDTISYFSLN